MILDGLGHRAEDHAFLGQLLAEGGADADRVEHRIDGDAGQDFLLGDQGNDRLFGDSGDDYLSGGADTGNRITPVSATVVNESEFGDFLAGGDGHDFVVGGLPVGYPALDGLVGTQFVDLFRESPLTPRPMIVPPNDSQVDFIAFLTAGIFTYDYRTGGSENFTIQSGGTDQDDLLHGDFGNDLLVGEDGDDNLYGDWGNDVLFGYRVSDVAAADTDRLEGGPDNDSPICGTIGANYMIGGTSEQNLSYILDNQPFASPLPGGYVFETCLDDTPDLLDNLPVEIHGQKFRDLNGDGLRNEDEQGLDGWIIELRDVDGTLLASATTHSVDLDEDGAIDPRTESGLYWFTDKRVGGNVEGMEAGVYLVSEVPQEGWAQTTPVPGLEKLLPSGDKAVAMDYLFDGNPILAYTVALESGEHPEDVEIATGIDFGNVELTSISGVKWHDLNGDGVQDADEPVIGNWTIQLKNLDTLSVDLTLTDAETGQYRFDGLAAGNYRVSELVPPSWAVTHPATGFYDLSVGFAETVKNVNFGNRRAITISGTKFEDLNANGLRDGGEPGVAGWEIYLDTNLNRQFDLGEPLRTTDANGMYSFTNLAPGIHVVAERPKAGWIQTFPGPADLGLHMFELESGDVIDNADFGNYRRGILTGRKINDFDGDGVLNQNDGLAGWQIYLDLNENGQLDRDDNNVPIEPVVETEADDPNTPIMETGRFRFTDLDPGVYVVAEVPRDGWVQTFPEQDPDTGRRVHRVSLESGSVVSFLDFGNSVASSIHGIKWNDLNANGERDANEPPVPNWTVYLDINENGRLDRDEFARPTEPTAVTMFDDPDTKENEAGRFWFENLLPGVYPVRELEREGWTQTWPPGGAHFIQIDQQTRVNVDFGNVRTGRITGTKWLDENGDGKRQIVNAIRGETTGDVGLAQWTIYLDLNNNGRRDDREPTAVTQADNPKTVEDETGRYEFVGLLPGTYVVREELLRGWTQSVPGKRAGQSYVVDLAAGELVDGLDFANSKRASIHGTKWWDRDGDGVRSEKEPGLANWQIYLDLNRNGRLDVDPQTGAALEPVTTTMADDRRTEKDESGQYWFDDLLPGNYLVAEVPQPGWTATFPLASLGGTHFIRLEGGQTTEGVDFGNQQVGDCDRNGEIDTADLILFARAFHSQRDDPQLGTGAYNACFDFEPDGDIDFRDLYVLAKLFREQNGVIAARVADRESGVEPGQGTTADGDRTISPQNLPASPVDLSRVKRSTPWTIQDSGARGGLDGASMAGTDASPTVLAAATPLSATHSEPAETITVALAGTDGSLPLAASLSSSCDIELCQTPPGGKGNGVISGVKWQDLDGDSLRDENEPVLPGVLIYLDLNNNGERDITAQGSEPFDITDASGQYAFDSLPANDYVVREEVTGGMVQTYPAEHLLATSFRNLTLFQLDVGNNLAKYTQNQSVKLPLAGVAVSPADTRVYGMAADGQLFVVEELRGVMRPVGQLATVGRIGSIPVKPNEGDFDFDPSSFVANAKENKVDLIFVSGADGDSPNTVYRATLDYSGCVGGLLSCLPSLSLAKPIGAVRSAVDLSGVALSDKGQLYVLDAGRLIAGAAPVPPRLMQLDRTTAAILSSVTLDLPEIGAFAGIDFNAENGALQGVYSGQKRDWFFSLAADGSVSITPLTQRTTSGIEYVQTNAHRIFLGNDEQVTTAHFGNQPGGQIHGRKFEDDGDGQPSPNEPGLPGWQIYIDLNENGQLDEGEPATTTDESGRYWFMDLPAGTFQIREVLKPGWEQTYPGGGDPDQDLFPFEDLPLATAYQVGESFLTAALDASLAHVTVRPFTLANGQVTSSGSAQAILIGGGDSQSKVLSPSNANVSFDFGKKATRLALIFNESGGNVNLVVNGQLANGASFAAFNGQTIAGVQVDVTQITDNLGVLVLSGLIDEFQIGGQELWIDNVTVDHPGQFMPGFHTVEVGPGTVIEGLDFGNRRSEGSIHGTKFLDFDGDGIRGPNDRGLPGWMVYLDLNDNGKLDPDEPKTTTERTGEYWFMGLEPGTYVVREVPQPGFTQTSPIVSFTRQAYDAGKAPASVAAGDIDGDGAVDLVLGDFLGRTAIPMLNDGQGQFSPSVAISLPDQPIDIELVDLDQDGDLDFLTTFNGTAKLATYRNEGSGKFEPWQTLDTGMAPLVIQSADFNLDGLPDVAVAAFASNLVYVYLNEGSGLLQAPQKIEVPAGPVSLETADFDHDGAPDLAVLGRTAEQIGLLLNSGTGDGKLSFTHKIETITAPSRMAVGDLDADGNFDFAVVSSASGEVAIHFGVSSTSKLVFDPTPVALPSLTSPSAVTTADIDGDEVADLLIADQETDELAIFFGDTNRRMVGPQREEFANAATDLVAANLNGDLKIDVAGADLVLPGATVLLQGPPGAYRVIIEGGDEHVGRDFGNFLNGRIQGTKFHDQDCFGDRDPGEPGLAGFTIYADLNDNGELDSGEPFAVTDESGNYTISDVPPGTYSIREVEQEDYIHSFPATGRHIVTIDQANETISGIDFGNFMQTNLPDGRDWIYGWDGEDQLYGDNLVINPCILSLGEDDHLFGQAGDDLLIGQLRNDTYHFGPAPTSIDETDTIVELEDGATDERWDEGLFDRVDFSSVPEKNFAGLGPDEPVLVDLSGASPIFLSPTEIAEHQRPGSARHIVETSAVGQHQFIEQIVGGMADDQLIANARNNLIDGQEGSDILVGAAGDDTYVFVPGLPGDNDQIVETTGSDTLDFSPIPDPVTVDLGFPPVLTTSPVVARFGVPERTIESPVPELFENIIGTSENDTLRGSDEENEIRGSGNDDVLIGLAGNDRLIGGPGSDRYEFVDGWGTDHVEELPAEGVEDVMDFTAVSTPLTFVVAGDIQVSDGANLATHPGLNVERLVGGAASDLITSGPGINHWVIDGPDQGTLNGVAFEAIENIQGGPDVDVFVFLPGGQLTGGLDAGGGDDIFDFRLGGSIVGPIVGGGGNDLLIGDDTNRTWTVTGVDQGSASGIGTFSQVENLVGGTGEDTFRLLGGTLSGLVDGAEGQDRVEADNVPTTFQLTGSDQGTLTGIASFANIENLAGNAQNDLFDMNVGSLSGSRAWGGPTRCVLLMFLRWLR